MNYPHHFIERSYSVEVRALLLWADVPLVFERALCVFVSVAAVLMVVLVVMELHLVFPVVVMVPRLVLVVVTVSSLVILVVSSHILVVVYFFIHSFELLVGIQLNNEGMVGIRGIDTVWVAWDFLGPRRMITSVRWNEWHDWNSRASRSNTRISGKKGCLDWQARHRFQGPRRMWWNRSWPPADELNLSLAPGGRHEARSWSPTALRVRINLRLTSETSISRSSTALRVRMNLRMTSET